jgi:hypothetical protein
MSFVILAGRMPEALQRRALLAAEIIRALDDGNLTVRKAESLTPIAAADFSRIRKANLDRFRLIG